MRKILFLAANPSQTARLDLAREVREIEDALRRSKNRDNFILEQRWAVRPKDLRRALLECQPDIIHFSGHGAGKHGLILEDDTGKEQLVSGDALAGLFGLFSKPRECVVLNACYSSSQAAAIAQNVDYVVGMDNSIDDNAAIAFAVGFYDGLAGYHPALFKGSPIEFAFNMARNALHDLPIPNYHIPQLEKNRKIIDEEWKILHGYIQATNYRHGAIRFPLKSKASQVEKVVLQELSILRAYVAAKASKDQPIRFYSQVN
ncbi:MAG: CHAT domain-containing protein [Nostoc sp. LLA-1]|nr:CHAT domain-containing protein [Cyanocohniella sp. LLY]